MNRLDILDYWRNPPPNQSPEKYHSANIDRSKMLIDIVKNKMRLSQECSVLEIGCNVGRNLNHLWNHGYRDLLGIDVNSDALNKMRVYYPELHCQLLAGPIETVLPTLRKPFVLIFSMAVLQHIPPENEMVFEHITRLGKYLLTIEDEKRSGWNHFPRDYKKVFEALGMIQLRGWRNLAGLSHNFIGRYFVKREK